MMKRELDVQLILEEPRGKFQVPIWNGVEKNPGKLHVGRTDGRTDARTHGQTDHYRAPAIWRGPNEFYNLEWAS
jgi:hypothetical protein